MADRRADPSRCSYNTDEAVAHLVADNDSVIKQLSSETETESSSEEEIDLESNYIERNREPVRRGGAHTRGGFNWARAAEILSNKNHKEQERLERIWKKEDKQPVIPDFTAQSGINATVNEETDTVDFLGLLLDDEFFKLLVNQTNPYAAQYIAAHPELPQHSRIRKLVDASIPEMKIFLSLYLLTGIVVKPELQQYWRINPPIKTGFFNNMMPRNRFQLILEFLHFNDKSQYNSNDPNCDCIYKACLVIEYLVNNFKSVYTPDKEVWIDKELLLWKGQFGFKQYIPNKRFRFGNKMFSLCKVSGYLWNSFVYVVKGTVETNEHKELAKNLGKSGAVAPKLMSDFCDKGYHLFIDYWYTSKNLLNFLRDRDTVAYGTAMGNRIKAPKSLKDQP